jgi:alpha-galactosidase/6-phospho-beta-glucosidase family protein
VNRLQASRSKTYDHQLIRDFGAIPIKHAASLYRKGEALYVRQYGLRSSAADVVARFGGAPSRRAVRWWTARKLASSANSSVPWYRACIVPFLETLSSGIKREHVLTWRHHHEQLEIPGLTAETTAVVEDGQAKPVAIGRPLPMAAQEWLRQVRASERLLIQAVDERSPSLLMESLAIHPSVASVSSAKQFAARYETQW